jgi:hypothetical protein
MTQISVVSSNYEFQDAWYNRILNELFEKFDKPSHVIRGTIRTRNETAIEPIIYEAVETLEFQLIATDIAKYSTHETTAYICTKEMDSERGILVFDISDTSLTLSLYSHDLDYNKQTFKRLDEILSNSKGGPEKTKFAFWQYDEDGCDTQYTNLACPTLEEIQGNYTKSVINQINQFVELEKPYECGKIILWHGPAGNGKTYLIRALSRQLTSKYKIFPEVIIDPEELFKSPKYLTSLLVRRPGGLHETVKRPYRLLIAEDCAQLFSTDCRNQDGFSRLLNTADGLLGQGQNVIFLFTANETIDEVDPAILRPGRCLQNLEIKSFSRKRAEQWLLQRGASDKLSKLSDDNSLAELYAILHDFKPAEDQRGGSIGFK